MAVFKNLSFSERGKESYPFSETLYLKTPDSKHKALDNRSYLGINVCIDLSIYPG